MGENGSTGTLKKWLGIQSPQITVDKWHISPQVDMIAYSFSWLWVLVPLLILGTEKRDYIWIYILVLTLTEIHRHIALPYVYMDRQVYSQFPLRFTIFPMVMMIAWFYSPWIRYHRVNVSLEMLVGLLASIVLLGQIIRADGHPARPRYKYFLPILILGYTLACGFSSWKTLYKEETGWLWITIALSLSIYFEILLIYRSKQITETPPRIHFFCPLLIIGLIGVILTFGSEIKATQRYGGKFNMQDILINVAVFAGLWNFWHVYRQKYGILRLYNAKSGNETKVSPKIDTFFVFAWLPLYFAYVGPQYREVAMANFKKARHILPSLLNYLESVKHIAVPICIILVAMSILLFLIAEWRANRFKNTPRLSMACGLTLLGSCFLFFDPIKVYLAFAFSHAVEYIVFVWAFQRRRYHTPLEHKPLLGKILTRPVIAYTVFILLVGGIYIYCRYWGKHIFPAAERPRFMDYNLARWVFYWGVYESMVHFYYDSFLWRMRLKSVRSNI